MIKEAIEKVVKRIDLTEAEMREVFDEIMSGKAAEDDVVTFLVGLRDKGETIEEITGAARAMREKAIKIDVGDDIVDTCGTGGSASHTFNISTVAAFVAAGAGVRIAKHGNRAASGRFGSADLLEALGVNIDAEPKTVQRCINEIGIGFMFAPRFHLAMKYAIGARKRIGTRTIFNILGPLANPAGAKRQLLGVYNPGLTEVMANVLKNLGSRHALVVCADDGIDEISIEGLTKVTELKEDGSIDTYRVRAKDFGLKESSLETIETASREENIEIAMSVLKGKSGPARDVILLNASAALIAGLKASDFKEGLKMAAESIDSEKALEKLHKLADLTKR